MITAPVTTVAADPPLMVCRSPDTTYVMGSHGWMAWKKPGEVCTG